MQQKRHSSVTQSATALLLAVVLFASIPAAASAAAGMEVSGWVPYWTGASGAKDAQKNLNALADIHPFGFTIKSDGTLNDLLDTDARHWQKLFRAARKKGVLVTPSITTSNGSLVHDILINDKRRAAHIDAIVALVTDGRYDGININYEGKRAETKEYFSLFLKELKAALGDKRLSCAVEARTPPEALYRTIPATLAYANDYDAIGVHCDRVEIMTYDQQRADILLNDARRGAPYIPVADAEWVRKVIVFTLTSIPKEKLMLGIPTYGHEYEVTVSPNWYQGYARLRAVNPKTALALAKKRKAKTSRNSAGEMGFTYATRAALNDIRHYSAPSGTDQGNKIAAQALAYANATGKTTVFNVVSWSDAQAIEAKVKLAREFDLAGVAIFKIDGGEDAGLWKLF